MTTTSAVTTSTFTWDDSSFQLIKLKTPIYGIVAFVELKDKKDFVKPAGKAFDLLSKFFEQHPEVKSYLKQDDSHVFHYPEDPSKEGIVYIQIGLLFNDTVDIDMVKKILADSSSNPKADPSEPDHVVEEESKGRLYQLFEATSALKWAVYRVRGTYKQIMPAYDALFARIESMGQKPAWGQASCFEYYANSMRNTKSEDLITDIYVPLRETST